MIKKLLIGVGVLLVLVIIAVGVVVVYIDAIAKSGIERATTTALGVNTSLGGMSIAILGGECTMDNLKIDNPAGYNTDYFFAMDHAEFAVSLGSLRDDKVIVPRLELEGLVINLEKQQGKSNYEVILENLRKHQGTEPTPDEQAQGKKYIVESLVIRDITVNTQLFDMLPTAIVVPEIILENVGSDTDRGLLLDQLSGTIIEAVMASVYKVAGDHLPDEIAGPLGDSLQSLGGIGDGGYKVISGLGQLGEDPEKGIGTMLEGGIKILEGAGNTADNVGKTGEGATRSIDDVGGAVKGIGDLFNSRKKPVEAKSTNEER